MMTGIRRFFEIRMSLTDSSDSASIDHRLKLTSAALMLEMTLADGDLQPSEQAHLESLLQQQYELSDDEVEELISLAHQERKDATDYYQFAKLINQHYSQTQKIQLIEQLWQIAFADEVLDKHEEHLIRRLSELIHVPHSAFIQSKHRAEQLKEK